MLRFNLSHLLAPIFLLFLLLLQTSIPILVQSRNLKPTYQPSNFLQNFEGSQKGQTNKGLIEVKQYLKRFGYLNHGDHDDNSNINLTGEFDENLESALKQYQQFNNLDVTGKLDANTIKQILIPRCGVPDIFDQTSSKHNHYKPNNPTIDFVSHYVFFPQKERWNSSTRNFTYSIHPVPEKVGIDKVRNAVASALRNWAAVTQFSFQEGAEGQKTDLVIGFYSRDHGDGSAFDGPGNVLAHAFPPENGNFHYDADERWSDNPAKDEYDLETVALHELGHVLGLEHSQDPNSVMVPFIGAGVIKRTLGKDDADGMHALYAS
ncbi:metalloendoproteinase 2-MMP-like [Quillaja saponaria]|uniref:Metalloendoproteinase 2-MMP-like n=1 Tax=Quillaja saponaria TaxID=32244 RepID=A0AAD7Q490_QUISA|nr:metalloendoproteinase 2-MMP-like [Quillaja saponaria]